MNLPKVITEFIKAQDNYDSERYANCFSDTGVMYDEGHAHNGKNEIQQWNAKTNEKYKTVMTPISYAGTGSKSILTATISGTFDGSPVDLQYHFELKGGLIQSLKITG